MAINAKHDRVCQHDESIRLNLTSTPGVVKKMNACRTEICDFDSKLIESVEMTLIALRRRE